MTEQTKPTPRKVRRDELPVSCPEQGVDPAGQHPRVFIPLKRVGEVECCPYCGAGFELQE
jgi:uncharacterized Zn-finger protein